MQDCFQETIGDSPPGRRRRILAGAPLPSHRVAARRASRSLLSASLLAASLLASSFITPSVAGQATAQAEERTGLDRVHPLPPVRLAGLLPPEIGDRGLDAPWDKARAGTAMRGGSASPLFGKVLANRQNVFGSVAVGMAGIQASGQWRRVVAENADSFFHEGCDGVRSGPCSAPGWARWKALHERAALLPLRERIDFVNREINRLVEYREDLALHGRRDHWATLSETVLAGAGDCEDYAIAKMWLLKALDVPLGSMQLVALRDERRGLDHAVLAVHLHEQILLLDNVHDRVLEDVRVAHYKPMFSFAGEQSFVHGFRKPAARMAAATP